LISSSGEDRKLSTLRSWKRHQIYFVKRQECINFCNFCVSVLSRTSMGSGNAVLRRFLVRSSKAVFLNCRAAARYRALASIVPDRETFSWNLSF